MEYQKHDLLYETRQVPSDEEENGDYSSTGNNSQCDIGESDDDEMKTLRTEKKVTVKDRIAGQLKRTFFVVYDDYQPPLGRKMMYDCQETELFKRPNQSVNSEIEKMQHNAKIKSKDRKGKKWNTEEIRLHEAISEVGSSG